MHTLDVPVNLWYTYAKQCETHSQKHWQPLDTKYYQQKLNATKIE
jgi:hypothetical protein